MDPFQLLIKPVSFDCNLRCTYCFYLRAEEVYSEESHPRMSAKVLEQMISQYMSYGFQESVFGWQGGEPTLAGLEFFKQVVQLQMTHGSSGQMVGNALQTNGVLINDEWGQFLGKYKFLIGLSLDGPQSIHDRYRKTKGGKSVWKKVMKAAEIFRKYGVQFNILCVVSKANVHRVKEVYDFFLEHDFRHLQFIPALEADTDGKRASFSVSATQYGKFLCDLFDLWKQEPHEVFIRLFNGIISHYLGYEKGFCSMEKTCADYLLVEWNGDVYPCDFFMYEKYKLGNLLHTKLAELKQRRDKDFGRLKAQLPIECQQCEWLELCYGGCIKDRIFPDNPHPERTYYCEGLRHFFSHANPWFKEFCAQL